MSTTLDPLAAARAILASPSPHDEVTRSIAARLVELEARARDWEEEADRAAAEVFARGKRLRAAGVEVASTVWDGPGVTVKPDGR